MTVIFFCKNILSNIVKYSETNEALYVDSYIKYVIIFFLIFLFIFNIFYLNYLKFNFILFSKILI